MSTNGISLSKFARRLGVTEGAVRKAIKSGRIPAKYVRTYKTKTGKARPEISDLELAADSFRDNTDHRRASAERPLEAGADEVLVKLRVLRERAKAQVDVAKARKIVGESIGRHTALQSAIGVIRPELNNLRTIVRSKPLSKAGLLAAIDACELAIMDAMEKRFAHNADEPSN